MHAVKESNAQPVRCGLEDVIGVDVGSGIQVAGGNHVVLETCIMEPLRCDVISLVHNESSELYQ